MDLEQINIHHPPFYTSFKGSAYLGNTLDLIKFIPDESLHLILTSPPFALTSKKEYGNKNADEYVDWFLDFAKEFKRVLRSDGSFVVDLGGAYLPGCPVRSIYQYELLIKLCKELGFFLAQEFFHYNPARLHEIGWKTLILGWWNDGEVFSGFDFEKHKGTPGYSSSIQIKEETLRKAYLNGMSAYDKGNNEIAIALLFSGLSSSLNMSET